MGLEAPLAIDDAMNGYFSQEPYSAWFRPAFEELLLDFSARRGGIFNIAIQLLIF